MKDAGENVKLVYDHLVVNGKSYVLAPDGESVEERVGERGQAVR
jgi:hypothetical protein